VSCCARYICTASKPVTLLLPFHEKPSGYETQLLTLDSGGLMRPGYHYTGMCQRALKQAVPQANVVFPKVRQAVWPMKVVKPSVYQGQLCAVQRRLDGCMLSSRSTALVLHRCYICLLTCCMNLCPQSNSSNAKRCANSIQVEAAIGAALFACKSLHGPPGAAAGQCV